MRNRLLLGGAVALMGLLPVGQNAFAQDGDQATDGSEQIVVTARRRAEQLRDVPASVTAITEAEREGLVLDRMDDYLRQVQSTTLVVSGPEYLNDITIRGQGSGRLGFSETATGLYRDGVYNSGGGFGGRTLSRLDLFDASRVEVLRGPQGALFGRNAVGGAINIVSHGPDDEFTAQGTVRYADPDRTDVEAVVNLPLGEAFGVRIGGFLTDQNEGFVLNSTTGNFMDAQRTAGGRVIAEARPTDSVLLSLAWEYLDSEAPGFDLGRNPTLDPEPYVHANQNREERVDIVENALTLRADFELNGADLSLRAARRERDGIRSAGDGDHFSGLSLTDVAAGAPVAFPDFARAQSEIYARDVFQALLTSRGDSRLRWLVGAEFLQSDDQSSNEPEDCPAYTGLAQPATPGCFVGTSGALAGTSASARNTGRLFVNNDSFTEDLSSMSVFGSIDYELAERWTLGLELRVQHDQRDYGFQRFSEDPLVYFGAGAPPAGLLAPLGGSGPGTFQYCPPTVAAPACAPGNEVATIEADRSDTFYTPTATLRWNFAEEQNVYLRFATGYRSGGFNTNLPPTTIRSELETALLYDAEYAYNYEAGWKGRFFGFNAEAAIFYTWTDGVQVVSAPAAGARGFVLSNAGDAHVYGFEAEARRSFDLGPGRLMARVAYSTLGGAFEDGATLTTQGVNVDLSGNEVPRLRDYQVTANLLYRQPIGSLSGFIGVSGQFADGGYDTPTNVDSYAGYELYDARLGLEGDHWRFSLFGRNLTDEQYVINAVSGNEFWSQPRVYGAELTLRY
jgi:outer membrane receptor protein involved in Fe transport